MAEDRLFWMGVFEALFAKWHGDKKGSKGGNDTLNKIRESLEEVISPKKAPAKKSTRRRRK